MLDVLLQLAASPTLGQIVVFDDVPELQSVGGLNRLFAGMRSRAIRQMNWPRNISQFLPENPMVVLW